MPKSKKLDKKAYNALMMSALIWGFTPLIYKKSLFALSIIVFLFLRYFIGSIAMYVQDRKTYKKIPTRTILLIAGIGGIECIMANVFYSYGIVRTSVLHASLLQLLIPFFVYIFAAFILHEKVHKAVIIGGLVSVCGLAYITLIESSAVATNGGNIMGDIAILGETICTALGVVLARMVLSRRKVPSNQYALTEYVVAAMFFGIMIVVSSAWREILAIDVTTWVWVFVAGIIGGSIPMRLYYVATKRLPAERIADASYVIPLISVFVGIFILGETLNIYYMIGASLVVAGLMVGHNKLHPVLIAHKMHIEAKHLRPIYQFPQRAYEYIRYN